MKLSATVSALLISALASSSGADARNGNTNAGSRRSVQLGNANLVKRVSLAQMQEGASSSSSNMQKKVKRQPLPNAAPIAAFGSIPSMNDGNMAIVGLNKRQASFDSHNGKQGTALTSSNTVSSSTNSGNNASTSTDSTGDDAEECEEDDEDDAEDCEEDDSADADDEECDDSEDADDEECDEEDDDEEDCEEEDDTDSTTASSSSTEEDTAAVATANVNVNLKQSNKSNGQSSSSSSSKKSESSATSSASQSKSTESSSSSVDGSSQTGIATWYTQNGNAGACGTVNPDSAKIIALYTSAYANGDNCGRSVVIKNLDDGTQTNAVVADMCPSCGGPQDIDLSVGAFQAIDPEYQTHGVRNIEWYFTD